MLVQKRHRCAIFPVVTAEPLVVGDPAVVRGASRLYFAPKLLVVEAKRAIFVSLYFFGL
ncbi:hypothetical protein X771_29760 [Mesorhizobium sp. LSJC277A00]|nr:hypothetical protein X771_29760 [Mesorhizobium sp. LSJC277A00]